MCVLSCCERHKDRVKGVYRFHTTLKGASRKALNATLRGTLAHAAGAEVPRRSLVAGMDALQLM
jgi:hypothetical protein